MNALNQSFDDHYPGISELSARISSYELAYACRPGPEAVDLSSESDGPSSSTASRSGHGILGRQCLLARRLVERGVRFNPTYERRLCQHRGYLGRHVPHRYNHTLHARELDKPITRTYYRPERDGGCWKKRS